jgi:hypothetical protein
MSQMLWTSRRRRNRDRVIPVVVDDSITMTTRTIVRDVDVQWMTTTKTIGHRVRVDDPEMMMTMTTRRDRAGGRFTRTTRMMRRKRVDGQEGDAKRNPAAQTWAWSSAGLSCSS